MIRLNRTNEYERNIRRFVDFNKREHVCCECESFVYSNRLTEFSEADWCKLHVVKVTLGVCIVLYQHCDRANVEVEASFLPLEIKLTPWSRNLPEQIKKFPAVYRTRRFITAFTRARHLCLF
jgi:hypothetical protein